MQFLYSPEAGQNQIELVNEPFLHLKARRVKESDLIDLRNLEDSTLYRYKISQISKRSIELDLIDSIKDSNNHTYNSHIAWCVVDSKVIEKTLPFLNELGIGTLTLVWCEKSQRNVRLDKARMQRIIYSSCEQCGRIDPMRIEIANPSDLAGLDLMVLDFEGEKIRSDLIANRCVVIGPEAGFSDKDYEWLKGATKLTTNNPLIMRSETAVLFIASLFAS